MEFSQAGHEIKYFRFRRVVTGVIIFGCLDDDIDNVREATAAATAFGHGVIDLCRHDQLPAIFIKKIVDDVPDFLVGYVIATADEHVFIPNMTLTIVFSAKEDRNCQENSRPSSDHVSAAGHHTPASLSLSP
ncbi:hypothetical protein KQ933_19365 [Rhizobium sp. WYJ-E13]|nr:hypothetical protein KQ933_19365 [Rhizobium sp. WYJ-E13]